MFDYSLDEFKAGISTISNNGFLGRDISDSRPNEPLAVLGGWSLSLHIDHLIETNWNQNYFYGEFVLFTKCKINSYFLAYLPAFMHSVNIGTLVSQL